MRVLLRKDLAELFAARAFWIVLVAVGLLVGQSFIDSVNAYADVSGPGALAEGLSPLDGIVTPTAGAYDLAIMLLFPFVAIRLVASEKSSDALKLMLQWPATMRDHQASKLIALLAAWFLSLIPLAIALAMWPGDLYPPEVLNVIAGYSLRFVLTASMAMAAAAVMPGAANAAVVVLGFTIGTWALDFMATGRGGFIQRVAAFTPAAVLRGFERGLLRIDVVLVMLILSLLALTIAGIWLSAPHPLFEHPLPARRGEGPRSGGEGRYSRTIVAVVAAIAAIAIASQARWSFDLSENRRNSLAPADAAALARIDQPLTMTIYLAAEDPRMNDLENGVLVKLRRAMPLRVEYPFGARSALFENDDRYGTIVYRLGTKTAVNRSTTEEIVLETIYGLAGRTQWGAGVPAGALRRGRRSPTKVTARPTGAAAVFYIGWPLAVITAWFVRRSRRTG